MNYEKKYKEALERARKIHTQTEFDYEKGMMEEVFPELKESEDEQHRKWILEYLYDGLRKSDEQFKDQFKSAISWLEKQGEQKSVEMSEEDKGFIDLLLAILTKEHQNEIFTTGNITVFNGDDVPLTRIITWLKSLKFQKQWKPTEEQLQTLHSKLFEGSILYTEDVRVFTTLYEDLLKQYKL